MLGIQISVEWSELGLDISFNPFGPVHRDKFFCSVDPDEMAHNEPSHLDLHCLPFWS